MEYLFLVILLIVFLCLETVLDNILWIGAIAILLLIISIIRNFAYYKEFGFNAYDLLLLLLKLGAIAFFIYLMIS